MKRVFLFALSLVLVSAVSAQDLAKRITLDLPASRASAAFAELSKVAGVALLPAGNLRDEVFLISVHDVSVDDVMQKIALAEKSKWVRQGDAFYLTRESSTSVIQERAELRGRTDLIAQAIAKLTASVKSQPAFTEATARDLAQQANTMLEKAATGGLRGKQDFQAVVDKTPTSRAIARILAGINPSKLASIGMNQRVVFSTDPTAMQQSLTYSVANAFRQFVSEQQLYTDVYNASRPQDGQNRMIIMNGFGTPTMGDGNPKLGFGVGLVIAQRRFSGNIEFQIVAADPNLDTLALGSYSMQLDTPSKTPGPAAGEQPLKLSAEALEMAKALGGGAAGGSPRVMKAFAISTSSAAAAKGDNLAFTFIGNDNNAQIKLSPELRAKVLNPEKYDPLSFVPGEAMSALGRALAKNVVALLPDTCFESLTSQFANDVTPSQLLGSLAPVHGLTCTQDDSWIVVSPLYPYSARTGAIGRPTLGNLLRSMDKLGWLHLDDVANYAAAEARAPSSNDLDLVYPRLVNSSAADRQLMPLSMGSWSLYRFFAGMSQAQRQTLMAGRPLPFASMSPQQVSMLADMVYNSPGGPSILRPSSGAAGTATSVTFTAQAGRVPMMMPAMIGGSAKDERTIVLPNGVPADGFLQGSVSSDVVVQGINSKTGATSMLDANTLGFSRANLSNPDLAGMSGQWDLFRLGHQTDISLNFRLTQNISLARSLTDQSTDPNAQSGPYDTLPAAFRSRVDQATQQLQGAMDKIPQRGGQTPPP